MKLILASGSPRRRRFLEQIGVVFDIKIPETEEVELGSPVETCVHNAVRKVKWVIENLKTDSDTVILGFDTIVYLEDVILGKPGGRDESIAMLKRLSGRWHEVYTGISISFQDNLIYDFEVTGVKFHELTNSQIKYYIDSGKSFDKAGSYGIQDENMSFIERIDGSFSNVVGFPLRKTGQLLRTSGIDF